MEHQDDPTGPGRHDEDLVVRSSTRLASPNDGALSWAITQHPAGEATLTVGLHAAIPSCEAPHLTSVVLAEPPAHPIGEPWELLNELTVSAPNDEQAEIRAVHLRPPGVNLSVGETRTWTLPVDSAAVIALIFGSMTDRMWVENDRHHLWLVHLDSRPGLFDWASQIGTDPLVHRSRLVVTPEEIRLNPIDRVRLSDIWTERDV